MIYLLWLLPILMSVVLYILYKTTDVYKIGGLFLLGTIIYTFAHKCIAEDNLTSDTEWYGNYAISVHYYDDWNEKVSCRHSYNCNCSTDKNGHESCSTCYEHSFDVDYHPEYWTMRWDNGGETEISRENYYYWCQVWGNKLYNIELNRDSYTNDGDDRACNWDMIPEHSETLITEHTYENRVIASHSVFKPDHVDSNDVKEYKLYEYPKCYGKQQIILGLNTKPVEQKLLEYINGYYGSKKQFKLFVTCWFNQSEIAAERQHSYWDNLNKNELLICIGLNKDTTVSWCKAYSWMDKPSMGVAVEQYFRDNPKINFYSFAKWLPSNIENHWSRKHFRDFKYIKIEITQGQYTAMFVVVLILCIIQAVVTKHNIET